MKKAKNIFGLLMMAWVILPLVCVGCSDSDDDGPREKVTSMQVSNVEGDFLLLIEGDTKSMEVALLPDEAVDADEYEFKYSSTNESVFTVDESGLVTAVAPGEAVLRVDAVNNRDMWTTCVVRVEERIYPVTSIAIPDEYKIHFMTVERSFDLGALVVVNPDNATNPSVIYLSSDDMIATVNEHGEVYTHSLGDVTITVKAVDGSNKEATCDIKVRNTFYVNADRTGWGVNIHHDPVTDATVNGAPECLIDESMSTCVLLIKPGKTFSGITIPTEEEAYFIVDMGEKQAFNFIKLRHRTSNTSDNLRARAISIWGSDDGDEFTELIGSTNIPYMASASEVTVDLPATFNYRHVKVVFEDWNKANGNTIQCSDFNLGTYSYED